MNYPPSFLDRVAEFMLTGPSGNDPLQTLVVLPNRRSQVFLKQALAKKAENDLWLPEMLAIDELMARLSGLTVVDPMVAWFELYRIHRELEKEKARPLDDFLSWAPLMLNDFSDADFSLAEAYKLFHELSEVKALEEWNLGERPLTEMQKGYLAFFRSLYRYYERLQMALLHDNTAYKAMAYRVAAEKLKKGETGQVEWKRFVFVGFNALTEAEKQVVSALQQHFELHYFIHADRYYFNSQKKQSHEAGRFLREIAGHLKIENPHWVDDDWLTQKKSVEVYGIPGHTGQAKLAGQLLRQWLAEEKAGAPNIAVVLADERLLIPLLESVPLHNADGKPVRYNVTMGYPLQKSPFYDLVFRWLQLLILREEEPAAKDRISLPALELLLQNPLLEMLSNRRLSGFFPVDRLYVPGKEVWKAAPDGFMKDLMEILFSGWQKPEDFLPQLKKLLLQIQKLPALDEKQNRLLPYQWVLMMQVIRLAEHMLNEQQPYPGFLGLQKVLLQLMERKEVSLKGEPLTGIQVMGMLETRNLDFDRVVLLGANEGVLPKTGFQESFIPYDLRRAFGLPLQNTRTAVTSYHFFRLLQHPRKVALVYNSEPDVLGGGEVSRFVLQMENELVPRNPQLSFRKKMVYIPLSDAEIKQDIRVEKEDAVMERLNRLAQSGLSPSALNTYVRCPLQFYYRYVAQVEVPEQPEVSVRANTFGSVVHGALETLYKPFTGKRIDHSALLAELEKNLDNLLQQKFREIYGNHDLQSGRNLLIYNVARRYVERFVKADCRQLQKQPRVLVGTERKIQAPLVLPGAIVNVKGSIDRLDKGPDGRELRVIDYKTGTVRPDELKLRSWELVVEDYRYAKALQVMVYAWMYRKQQGDVSEIIPGIISLKRADGMFVPVVFPEDAGRQEVFAQTEKLLLQLAEELLDPEKPFVQTEEARVCQWCDYKNLCNRF